MVEKPTFSREYLYQLVDTTDGNPTRLERIYDFAQLVAIILSLSAYHLTHFDTP